MKKIAFILIGLLSAAFMSACGKSSSNNRGTGNVVTCPSGYVISNGVCVLGGSVGTISGTFYDFNYSATGYGSGNLTIRSAAAYKEFLKSAMGVCDRSTWNGGAASCDAWIGGFTQIALSSGSTSNSNTVSLQIRAWPQQSYWTGNFGIDTQGAYRNPLTLSGTVSVINNYQGFEVRAYGDYYTGANRSLIQLMVKNGKLENSFFEYELYYPVNGQAVLMASGTLRRY